MVVVIWEVVALDLTIKVSKPFYFIYLFLVITSEGTPEVMYVCPLIHFIEDHGCLCVFFIRDVVAKEAFWLLVNLSMEQI